MRIAFIGIKGLPVTFSGVETHVNELASRLAQRGHDVVAYVRPQHTPPQVKEHNGVRLIHRSTIPTKHLDATVHSLLSALHTLGGSYDIIHFHAIGPGAFVPLARLSGAHVVTTIHAFDYRGAKWGWFARACLRTAERICLSTSHRSIVVAKWVKEHYQSQGFAVDYVPNGVPLANTNVGATELRSFGLQPNQYYLFLGRLVPEKRVEWAIRAFLEACDDTSRRLVVAGGSSATDEYVADLKTLAQSAGDRVLLTGPVYGQAKEQLIANSRLFLLPSASEGLPITVLEAMSHGRACLASDIAAHRDIIVDDQNGYLHSADSFSELCDRLKRLDKTSDDILSEAGAEARRTVLTAFDWENIVDRIERIYVSLLGADVSTESSDCK